MTSFNHQGGIIPEPFCVARAVNDVIFTEDGRRFIDLLCGSGTVLLGHGNPTIVARLSEQVGEVWNTGALPTRALINARSAVERFLESRFKLAVLYTTGMEAAEFALRLAHRITGREEVVGFDGCMHGKSTATAQLGWPNDLLKLEGWHRLAYLPELSEDAILENLRRALSGRRMAAVFLEPLLGSRGAYMPSSRFATEVSGLCAEFGTLLVVDEILTGFHRTGSVFLYPELGLKPDILLVGKTIGNGFPVAGVVVDSRYEIPAETLPGSTYSGNPLAAVTVKVTLEQMLASEVAPKIDRIAATVQESLGDLPQMGIGFRGKGAFWMLEFQNTLQARRVTARVFEDGVIVSPTSKYIRLFPAATMSLDHLQEACSVIGRACRAECGTGR